MEDNNFTKIKNIAFLKIQSQNNAHLYVWKERRNS